MSRLETEAWANRVAELFKLAPTHSTSEIARRLGVTKNSVLRKMRSLGIPRLPRGPAALIPDDQLSVGALRERNRRRRQHEEARVAREADQAAYLAERVIAAEKRREARALAGIVDAPVRDPDKPLFLPPRHKSPQRSIGQEPPVNADAVRLHDIRAAVPSLFSRPARPVDAPAARSDGDVSLALFERVTGCQWPVGDPQRSDYRVCDAPVRAGKPYCDGHCEASYAGIQMSARAASKLAAWVR